jgi:quercetin dioxygenase-like cupin family protein
MTEPHRPTTTTRTALFGGRGAVQVTDLLGALPADPFRAVLLCVLDARGAVGRHRQEEHPEILIALGGAGRVTVDDRACAFGPGTVVHLPHGSVLAIENDGDEPLEYLIVKAAIAR